MTGTQWRAEFFGKRALLKGQVRQATVKVTSAVAKGLTMDKQSFELLMGPLADLISKQKPQDPQLSTAKTKASSPKRKKYARLSARRSAAWN